MNEPTGRRAASLLLALTLVSGCDEMRRPREAIAPPAGLIRPAPDPVAAALAGATAAFADHGVRLRGKPTDTARAAGQLEYVVTNAPAWANPSAAVVYSLESARTELRTALGIPAAAAPRGVMVALASVALALDRGDGAAARAALVPVIFPGGEDLALRRLADPGALPNAEQATVQLTREVSRAVAEERFGVVRETGAYANDVLTEGLGRGF